MTWPRNAEDRPGGQLGRSPKGKRNNIQSAQNIVPPVRSVNARNLHVRSMNDQGEAAIRDRIDALSDRMDVELRADKRFFERWPHRNYRVRRSFRAEAEITSLLNASDWPMTSLMNGADWPLRPGIWWYSAVRQLAPGYRVRTFFLGPSNLDCCGMPDEAAKRIFDALNNAPVIIDEIARIVAEKRAAA